MSKWGLTASIPVNKSVVELVFPATEFLYICLGDVS